MTSRGAVYVAIGPKAQAEAGTSSFSLGRWHPDLPVKVITHPSCIGFDDVQLSRWIKTGLFNRSPYDHTVYLDADTRVYGKLNAGFRILEDGWDLVITPSEHQGADLLWHVDKHEVFDTGLQLGHQPLGLQGGMFFFRKNYKVGQFFSAWRDEWMEWKGQDQAALLRALNRVPLKVWLLGRPFNGGAVIGHLFGRLR